MRGPEGLGLVGLEDDLTLPPGVSTHPPYRDRRHSGDGGEPVDGAAQGAPLLTAGIASSVVGLRCPPPRVTSWVPAAAVMATANTVMA